jgi:hypothetical protein
MKLAHHCHAVECGRRCPREHLFCRRHWAATPSALKTRIYEAYRKGQERGHPRPSQAWLDAVREAKRYLHALEQPQVGLDFHRK